MCAFVSVHEYLSMCVCVCVRECESLSAWMCNFIYPNSTIQIETIQNRYGKLSLSQKPKSHGPGKNTPANDVVMSRLPPDIDDIQSSHHKELLAQNRSKFVWTRNEIVFYSIVLYVLLEIIQRAYNFVAHFKWSNHCHVMKIVWKTKGVGNALCFQTIFPHFRHEMFRCMGMS